MLHTTARRRRERIRGPAGRVRGSLAAGLLAASCGAWAQEAGPGLRVTPSFDSLLTWTHTSQAGQEDQSNDLITEIRPGVQARSQSGRVQGSLSYALRLIHHTKPNPDDEPDVQHQLNSQFTAEAVPGFAYLDGTASVSQQSLSAFGVQSVDDTEPNANRAEVANVSLSPYLRGDVGGLATYEARLTAAATNALHSKAGDSTTQGGSLALNSAHTGAYFGWGLQASRERSDYRLGRATVDERAIASVTLTPDPEIQLTVRGGQESTNVGNVYSRTYGNYGGDIRWAPNERTLASVSADRRYYGSGYNVVIQHRLPQSTLRLTSTRDASNGGDASGVGQPVTLYQLFFEQFASVQPDPVLRDQMVLDFLRSLGQDPNAIVNGGFASSAVTLQQRSDLAWTYTGRRLTLTLQAFSSYSSVLDNASPAAVEGDVRQNGFNASIGYKLTPTASASLMGSHLTTAGNDAQPGNDLKSIELAWTDQLGRRISASLTARFSKFDSVIDSYRETALTASLSLRF